MKGVLFDLDGTLIDTAPDLYLALCKTMGNEGLSPVSYEQARKQVSNGARALICDAFNITLDHPELPRLNQSLLTHYGDCIHQDSSYFEGILGLINWLQDNAVPWGIITNKPERFTIPLLESFGILDKSQVTLCPEHVSSPKPAPESMFLAAKRLNLTPEECVYIGDHPRDIQSGQNAHMKTIAALYGYLDSQLATTAPWGAEYSVTDSQALLPLLESLITRPSTTSKEA